MNQDSENMKELERINKKLTSEQKQLLESIIPNYNSKDVVELEELLSEELQIKGLTDDGVNEYGAKIESIIDVVVDG